MGSFALRMALHQKSHGKPLPREERPQSLKFAVSLSVTVKIETDVSCEAGITAAVIGENLVLADDDRQVVSRVAVVSKAGLLLGWLPADDPFVPRLYNGAGYHAELRKVVRGSGDRRFASVYIAVGLRDGEVDASTV